LLPLRYPKIWVGLGALLLLGVITGSLVPAQVIEEIKLGDKLEHMGSYFVLMFWFGGMWPRSRQVWVAVGLCLLGVVLDLLQGLTPTRTLDPADMAANGLGVVFALALTLSLLTGWCQRVERLFS
jgi:VanZ family protein